MPLPTTLGSCLHIAQTSPTHILHPWPLQVADYLDDTVTIEASGTTLIRTILKPTLLPSTCPETHSSNKSMAVAVLEQAPPHLATIIFNVGNVPLHTLMTNLPFNLQTRLLVSRVCHPLSYSSTPAEPSSLHLHHSSMLPALKAAADFGRLTALESLHVSLRADDLDQVLLLLPRLTALRTLGVQASLSEREPVCHFRSSLGILACRVSFLRQLTALELNNFHGADSEAEALLLAFKIAQHSWRLRSLSLRSCWWPGQVVSGLIGALACHLHSLHLEQAEMLAQFQDDSPYWNPTNSAELALALCKCSSLQSLVIRWEPWLTSQTYRMLYDSQHHASASVLPVLRTHSLQFTNLDWPCHKSLLWDTPRMDVPNFASSLQHLRLFSLATNSATKLYDILASLAGVSSLRRLAITVPELDCDSLTRVSMLLRSLCSLTDLEMAAEGHSTPFPGVSGLPLKRLMLTRAPRVGPSVIAAILDSHHPLPSTLQHLHISTCGVQSQIATHKWWATCDFCVNLGRLTQLSHLELHGAHLGSHPLDAFDPSSQPPLSVDPGTVTTMPATASALVSSLKNLSQLTTLNISGSSAFSSCVAEALSKSEFSALRHLGLCSPGNARYTGPLCKAALQAPGFLLISQLRSLCFSRSVLRQCSVQGLLEALACKQDLEELRAPGCCLLDGRQLFVQYLAAATALRRLDLGGADLQKGLGVLSEALASPQCVIQELLLADSTGLMEASLCPGESASSIGVSAGLLWLLANSVWLQHVDLSRCGVSSDALDALVRSLQEAHPVVRVDVRYSRGPSQFVQKPCDVFTLRIASESVEQQQRLEDAVEDLAASTGGIALTRSSLPSHDDVSLDEWVW